MSLHTPHPWRGFRPWKRHSLVLMVAGVIYCLIGLSYLTTEPTPTRALALKFAFAWWSPEWWGVVFILVGGMAILSSKWPPAHESWGYMALTGLSSGWAAFYAVGIVFGNSPWTNVSGVLSWGLLGFMWWAISGLVNPDTRG